MLNITDQQIKELSLTVLQLPFVIDNPIGGNGLVQSLILLTAEKDRNQKLDSQNKIFTDHWIDVLSHYYTERELLNKTKNTLYCEETLQLGGIGQAPHYDNSTWYNLNPILTNCLRGLPESIGNNPSEKDLINAVNVLIGGPEEDLEMAVGLWEASLLAQESLLNDNRDLSDFGKSTNAVALAHVESALSTIDFWQANKIIEPLTSLVTTRQQIISSRLEDIELNLGAISQDEDGSIHGSGAYVSLYNAVCSRIQKGCGTLHSAYITDHAIKHSNLKVEITNTQLNQYASCFAIASIITDTTIGQIAFEIDSITDFSVGQIVKIMDNDSVVFTRTVDTINNNTITLNTGIIGALSVSKNARIVRLK